MFEDTKGLIKCSRSMADR